MLARRSLFVWFLAVALAAGFGVGFATHKYRTFPYPLVYRAVLAARAARQWLRPSPKRPPGSWQRVRPRLRDQDPETLLSLPYLSAYERAPERSGVRVHDPSRTEPGLNLVVSGHAPGATLLDLQGRTLHEWRYEIAEVWPERPRASQFWRRARAFPNGDLLAIFDGVGLIKIDRDSRLLWAHAGGSHHDVAVAPDGRLYVLDREVRVVPRIHPEHPIEEDFISVLDPSGRLERRVSILEAFERSSYAPLLERRKPWGDLFHTNTIALLDGRLAARHPAFRAGNVLISVRELDTVAVLDLDSGRIVWALTGQWSRQHEPRLLDDGRLLLFDNRGAGGLSRVLEVDPFNQEIAWEYRGEPGEPLASYHLGSCQRLPNGNTLITESARGRALEVTRDGKVVWEYVNPHRAGERGEWIATLLDVVRLPASFFDPPLPDASRSAASGELASSR